MIFTRIIAQNTPRCVIFCQKDRNQQLFQKLAKKQRQTPQDGPYEGKKEPTRHVEPV